MADRGEAADSLSRVECLAEYKRLSAQFPGSLDRSDLETLANASFWLGHLRESIAARERVYAIDRDAKDAPRAARSAWRIFYGYFDLDDTAVANGWLKRAEQHVADAPGLVEEGYVSVAASDWALYRGRLDEAVARAERGVAIGRQHADRDLIALGQATHGRVLVHCDDAATGVTLLDEAMVAAVSDELSPFMTGNVYCVLLSACETLGDLRRAGEWSDLALLWCDRRGLESWYPGVCRLHRCQVQSFRGQWEVAEREALRATEELVAFGDYMQADSWYLIGDIRRRKGDTQGAEQAFQRAHALGRDPQPGMALLRLAQGDAHGAERSLRTAIASSRHRGPLHRGQLLSAHVDAALGTSDAETAQASAHALKELAETANVAVLTAMATRAIALVLLDSGDAEAAFPHLRNAYAVYHDSSCPYEAAEMRMLTGVAARRVGDEATARLEFDAAATEFRALGATADAERTTTLAEGDATRPSGLTRREAQVLQLIAHGKSNREIAAALYISEHTVARHVSNILRKIGVTSRSAAAAFAFERQLA